MNQHPPGSVERNGFGCQSFGLDDLDFSGKVVSVQRLNTKCDSIKIIHFAEYANFQYL